MAGGWGACKRGAAWAGAGLLLAAPVGAQTLRDLCSDRPGLNTPACIVDQGHLQVEVGIGDWTLDKQTDSRTDTILAGDLALRYGLGDTTELRAGWTSFGHERMRDRMSGEIERKSRVGDITLGLKQSLTGPDGKGVAIALLPEVSVPIGRQPIGAGDWGAGLRIPADFDLTEKVQLQITPEIDAAVDEDGHGRHFAFGSAAGIEVEVSETITIAVEGELLRDRDPDQHTTMALAGLSLAYKPQARIQFDLGTNAGLNRDTPDVEVYFGVSRKF